MNNEKKLTIQQQAIESLEKENLLLKQENEALKQMIPNGTDIQPVKEVYIRLQKELAEALRLKKQYETANQEIKIIRQNYETEVRALISRLRGDVAAAEETRAKFNLR